MVHPVLPVPKLIGGQNLFHFTKRDRQKHLSDYILSNQRFNLGSIPPLEWNCLLWHFIFFRILLFLGGVDFCHECRRDNKRPIKLNFMTFPKLQFWTSSLKKPSRPHLRRTPAASKKNLYVPLTRSARMSNRDKIIRIAKNNNKARENSRFKLIDGLLHAFFKQWFFFGPASNVA